MIKKIFGTVVGAVVLTVAGKMVSDFAETKPSLKNVKDKLKKNRKRLYGWLQRCFWCYKACVYLWTSSRKHRGRRSLRFLKRFCHFESAVLNDWKLFWKWFENHCLPCRSRWKKRRLCINRSCSDILRSKIR